MAARRRPGGRPRPLRSVLLDRRAIHPYKERVPGGHVAYAARRMRGSRIAYFNYALAREMGLIPADSSARMTAELEARAIARRVHLRIINEYDLERRRRFPESERLPQTYMATRYLALQHPGGARAKTSWGRPQRCGTAPCRTDGATWDVTSCGTGVTRSAGHGRGQGVPEEPETATPTTAAAPRRSRKD